MTEKNYTNDIGLVDTNILVYLADADLPKKHRAAKKFLDKILESPAGYVVALQNLREFSSVLLKKTSVPMEEIWAHLDVFHEGFQDILVENVEDIKLACQWASKNRFYYWDALLVATMKRKGIRKIYTEDKHFSGISWLTMENPLKKDF